MEVFESIRPVTLVALYCVFTSLLLLIPPGMYLSWRFRTILKDRHPEVWQHLVQSWFIHRTAGPGRSVTEYVKGRHYQSLNDTELTRYGDVLRILNLMGSIGFFMFFLLLLIAGLGA